MCRARTLLIAATALCGLNASMMWLSMRAKPKARYASLQILRFGNSDCALLVFVSVAHPGAEVALQSLQLLGHGMSGSNDSDGRCVLTVLQNVGCTFYGGVCRTTRSRLDACYEYKTAMEACVRYLTTSADSPSARRWAASGRARCVRIGTGSLDLCLRRRPRQCQSVPRT